MFKKLEARILEALREELHKEVRDFVQESAFREGFAKGFDFALSLQGEKFREHLALKVEEARQTERIRYDEALKKLETKHA